ncbi:MAG: hypothetical protein QN203_08135 [Armatimonadota bacterium]|nr:hypothetical protein [Armatimonadota bacterium]
MPTLSPGERQTLTRSWARSLQQRLRGILPKGPGEADFRRAIEPLLDDFCREVGVNPLAHAEYTLATGRADAVFNRLVVEYERPGTLKKPPDAATRNSIRQVRDYIDGLARRERHAAHRLRVSVHHDRPFRWIVITCFGHRDHRAG